MKVSGSSVSDTQGHILWWRMAFDSPGTTPPWQTVSILSSLWIQTPWGHVGLSLSPWLLSLSGNKLNSEGFAGILSTQQRTIWFSTLLHKMVPWWLEETVGRTRLIKNQLTKLLIPMLALLPKSLGYYCPDSPTRLKWAQLPPSPQPTARLGDKSTEWPRNSGGGAASSSRSYSHQVTITTLTPLSHMLLQILRYVVLYSENCRYSPYLLTFLNWVEFWKVVLLTSQRVSSLHSDLCLFNSESLLIATCSTALKHAEDLKFRPHVGLDSLWPSGLSVLFGF